MQTRLLLGLIFLLWSCPAALAGGMPGANWEIWNLEALPPRLDERVRKQDAAFARLGLSGLPRGVYSRMKLWPPDKRVLRVCFMDSPQQTRRRIARYANQWTEVQTRLKFDFGDLDNPRLCDPQDSSINHIRVGFDDIGYWSFVGQDSINENFTTQAEKSMNLEAFDVDPPHQVEFRRVVLHEFGHALGLQHEHQNPLSECEREFDWERIYRYFEGPPNHWNKDLVDHNMRSIHEPGLMADAFDRDSIMLYTFPADYFFRAETSPCFAPSNSRLSGGDRAIMERMYPQDAMADIGAYQATREAVLKAARPAEGDRSTQDALGALKNYLPEVAE
jgi:hypothetical protein